MRETFFMFYTIFLLLHFRTDAACLSPPLLHGTRVSGEDLPAYLS